MHTDHLLAIPVFNEERYVDAVLEQARRYSRSILVIDDGSTDGTAQLLRRHSDIRVIRHAENRGYGKSLSDAFCYAQRHGFPWLITMDCDEQHEPEYIPRFLEAAARGDVDVISGTRYPQGHEADLGAPADRREINRYITALINQRLGLGITDAFCGFKAYRVSTLKHMHITVPGYAMPMQWWVQVARAGLRVVELPIRLIYNDPARHFGGQLDDPEVRLAHYIQVFEQEAAIQGPAPSPAFTCSPCCL